MKVTTIDRLTMATNGSILNLKFKCVASRVPLSNNENENHSQGRTRHGHYYNVIMIHDVTLHICETIQLLFFFSQV